jgi:hypothetical protein
VQRDFESLHRRDDGARARFLLRRDVAHQRPELERRSELEDRVAEAARDAGRAPRFELAAQLRRDAEPVLVEIAEHHPQIA